MAQNSAHLANFYQAELGTLVISSFNGVPVQHRHEKSKNYSKMEGLLTTFGSLKIDDETIKRAKVLPEHNAQYHFKPIFDLIKENDWIKERLQNPEVLLQNFVAVHGNTLNPQNFSEILKLALVAEYRNEIDFSDKNSIPSGIFALNPTEDQGGGEVSFFSLIRD